MPSKEKKRKRAVAMIVTLMLIGVLVFAAIQLFVIAYSNPFIIDKVEQLENIDKPDAVLVLGAGVYADKTVSPALADRLNKAYEAYMFYDENIAIIVSGDNKTVDYNEPEAMYAYLVNKGVKPDRIFKDYAGFDTYDSIYRADYIFQTKNILVCTQRFHVYRAVYTAKRMGFTVHGFAAENKSIYNMKYNNIRESLARVKAILETELIKRKSKYLGSPIPIPKDFE